MVKDEEWMPVVPEWLLGKEDARHKDALNRYLVR
jgi:hypothetical protein